MIVPVLNKKSTVAELANLCWLLNEVKIVCEDSNLRWRIAQLESYAEELNEKFLEDSNLPPFNSSKYYTELLEKLPSEDRTVTLLSFAFQSAATIDSALYEEFKPSKEFTDKIKLISKETLQLLHEKRGLRNEDE